MSAPELKPCPFCGGEAYLRDDVSHSTAFFIGCTTEDCFGEIHWEQTAAEAVTAWNTRAPTAQQIAAAEAAAYERVRERITGLVSAALEAGLQDRADGIRDVDCVIRALIQPNQAAALPPTAAPCWRWQRPRA